MEKRIINGEAAYVGDALKGFSIHVKESTNVEFFGSNPNGKIFAQFKTGSTYVYSQVPDDVRAEMERATSIGSFIAQLIVKPKLYPSVKYSDRLVKLEKQVQDGQYNAVDQWL
jgi:hypothetical protein